MSRLPQFTLRVWVGRKKHVIRIIIKIYLYFKKTKSIISMGNDVSVEQKQMFEEKIRFHQQVDDQQLGPLQIYRFKEPPYQYLMNHQKNFVDGDLRPWEKYYEHMKKLKTIQHKNLAKIHLVDAKKQTHLCLKGTKINTFCSYYNFTLRQGINKKKIKQTRFTQSQLVYIFWCVLDAAFELQNHHISIGQYRAQRIYLSPEGYIKVYLLEIEKDNKHRAYYKALVQKSKIDQLILAPQQLINIYQLVSQPSFDIYKADLFAISLMILELMTLEHPKFYYNEDRNGLKMGRIYFDLNSFGEQYSPPFLDLLRNCLEENPAHRLTINQALLQIQHIKKLSQNVSYCIRFNDDDQNKKKKITTTTSVKSQYLLSGIQKRLTPIPIQTLSQSTSSGMQSKNSIYRNQDSRLRR